MPLLEEQSIKAFSLPGAIINGDHQSQELL